MKPFIDLLGRMLLSVIFFFEAYDSIRYFDLTRQTMTEYGITWRQDLLLIGAIGVLILGATLILIGYRPALGVLLLLLYWVPVTFIVHAFWNVPQEDIREAAISFMKNIAIIGGLLMVYVNGAGKWSIKRLFATSRVPGA